MFSVKEPEFRWGIASWGTEITGRLFCDDLFVFKRGAEERIQRFMEIWNEEGSPKSNDYVFPVLVKIQASICSDEETTSYDDEQATFLAERKTKRIGTQKETDRG